jgi:hypothetical protein
MKREGFKCCICGKWRLGWGDRRQFGNNPQPLRDKGQCCEQCNSDVIVARCDEYYKQRLAKKDEVK